jgi:hypothetical protein
MHKGADGFHDFPLLLRCFAEVFAYLIVVCAHMYRFRFCGR